MAAVKADRGYKQIASKVGLPGWDDMSLNTSGIVSKQLLEYGDSLLVFDNADDVDFFCGHNRSGPAEIIA